MRLSRNPPGGREVESERDSLFSIMRSSKGFNGGVRLDAGILFDVGSPRELIRCSLCACKAPLYSNSIFKCSDHVVCMACLTDYIFKIDTQHLVDDPLALIPCPVDTCPNNVPQGVISELCGPKCTGCHQRRTALHNENLLGCKIHIYCDSCANKYLDEYLIKNFFAESAPCPSTGCSHTLTQERLCELRGMGCVCCGITRGVKSSCGSIDHYVCPGCFCKSVEVYVSNDQVDFHCPGSSSHVIDLEKYNSSYGRKCAICFKKDMSWTVNQCPTANCHFVCRECFDLQIENNKLPQVDPSGFIACLVCKRAGCISVKGIRATLKPRCLICFERKADTKFVKCQSHFACDSCLVQYCQYQVLEQPLTDQVCCPAGANCSVAFVAVDLLNVLPREIYRAWLDARIMQQENLRCKSKACFVEDDRNSEAKSVSLVRQQAREAGVLPQMLTTLELYSPENNAEIKLQLRCSSCDERSCLICREIIISSKSKSHKCKDPDDAALLASAQNEASRLKPCPRCLRLLHRYEGCKHMTCGGVSGCRYEFCWQCLVPWSSTHVCPIVSVATAPRTAQNLNGTHQNAQQTGASRRHLNVRSVIRTLFHFSS